jgi:CRISPR system Cascade subunit CasC
VIVELHLLQNVSPSCLNRDDTNTPKDAEFGGHRRARISSQCLKRSVRRFFRDRELLPAAHLAVRTKRLLDEAVATLVRGGRGPEEAARRAVTAALAAGGLKVDDKGLTQYLLFLGRAEVDGLVRIVADHFETLAAVGADKPAEEPAAEADGKAAKKAVKKTAKQEKAAAKKEAPEAVVKAVNKLLDGGKAADLALFGRMLADSAAFNIDAACQVAHALSTNRAAMEMDYFTAVDDLQERSDDAGAGAGMIGTVEFNSSCFYRYANIDSAQLLRNLGGDADLARRTVAAFLRAAVEAVPSGKQNTFAAHNPPSLVFAVVRRSGQWNLANAFVRPVGAEGAGLVANSVRALDAYWGRLVKMYGPPAGLAAAVATTEDGALDALAGFRTDGVAQLYKAVEDGLGKGDR